MTTHLTDQRVSWMTEGACRTQDPDLFFPISAGDASAGQVRQALSICDHCKVRTECLHYALNNQVKHGIWGGRTEQERLTALRSRRRRRPDRPPGR